MVKESVAPPADEAEAIIELRAAWRRGHILHPDAQKRVEAAFLRWPKWYRSTQAEVRKRSISFGA